MIFEFGAFGPLLIREERVYLGLPVPLRLLYASDLHFGHFWTSRVPDRLVEAARITCPDLILLGGDLVDNTKALPGLGLAISSLLEIAPVYAIPGNHDERVGIAKVRDAVRKAGGRWLTDEAIETPARIDGAITTLGPRPRILCAHHPSIFPVAAKVGYDLVFAGHLHGGQCVFFNRNGKQYPAVWLNRWHGQRFTDRNATLLVSRGAADTFPFRFNCPREIILCEIK